jgi:glutaminyl-peptide cyclotransferase
LETQDRILVRASRDSSGAAHGARHGGSARSALERTPAPCEADSEAVAEQSMSGFRIAVALAAVALAAAPVKAAVPVYGVTVVHAYPHDPEAFTEGLFYLNGFLYESTGLEGKSSVRKVELSTGKVLQSRPIDSKYFGEGIVAWDGKLVQLTWKSEIGFTYDLATFKPRASFHYTGEGWALTQDGHRLIMSDGTPQLRFLDPVSLREAGRVPVTLDGRPLANINELEWVKGEVLANIWQSNYIARIDPKTGKTTGVIDLKPLADMEGAKGRPIDVPNGIAYDAVHDRLFVTGKLWPDVFEIKLTGQIPGVTMN